MRRLFALGIVLVLAGCGGGGSKVSSNPIESVPTENGIRAAVKTATKPSKNDFPPADGTRTLEDLANGLAAGPQLALASSVFTVGENRIAFGMIGKDGVPIYGPTAVYVAPAPGEPAEGPFVAPADVLLTAARYRSEQAAKTTDPFAAVYAAQIKLAKTGPYSVLAMTKRNDGVLTGASATIENVVTKSDDEIPAVGSKAPKVHTDTLESAKGDVAKIDTRIPPSDMHAVDFAEVVGKKPVALVFSTPQLCASKVCGPVTDIAMQMEAKYGDRMDFIHQEVYVDNEVTKGLRPPLQEFHLPTEPWLFTVDKQGKITSRLEGSIGINAFESAVKSAL